MNRIGLVIWGVQSGHRVFCSNAVIPDPELPEIKATWGDIRSLVVVNNLSVQFYALEFTQNFKVFTLYRPVNDFGRSGGYVAVTLYVPHQLKLQDTRRVLESISQAYLSDHYSFGEPLNVAEDIAKYQHILSSYAAELVQDDESRSWRQSEQNHLTKLVPYNDVSVVDKFFCSPYREDFTPYQEIMFWSLSYLQNPAQFGITFLRELEQFELNGTNVSEEYHGDMLAAISPGMTLSYFKKNGVDCTGSYFKMGFYGPTRIAFELSRNDYFLPIRFEGTIDEAIRNGFLYKSGKNYTWRPGIQWVPKEFQIMVHFNGLEDIPLIFRTGIGENSMCEVRHGSAVLTLRGEEVQYQKVLFIEEYGLLYRVKMFVPEELPMENGYYLLNVDSLQFIPLSFTGDDASLPNRLSFGIRGYEGLATLDPYTASGLILPNGKELSDVNFSSDRYGISLNGNQIVLKKLFTQIRIVLPRSLAAEIKASNGMFGILTANGDIFQLAPQNTEILSKLLPNDKIQLYYLPDPRDRSIKFPVSISENQITQENIIVTPRMMRVNNPSRISFWMGSKTVQNRNWVARNGRTYSFIPEANVFSSSEEGCQFKIESKDEYSVLNVNPRPGPGVPEPIEKPRIPSSDGRKGTNPPPGKRGNRLLPWILGIPSLIIVIGVLWFVFVWEGKQVARVSFVAENSPKEHISITATDPPKHTKAMGSELIIYKKFTDENIHIELAFGEKKDGKYSDGKRTSAFRVPSNDTIIRVKIKSVEELGNATNLSQLHAVYDQYNNSTYIQEEAPKKAQDLVSNDIALLSDYKKHFGEDVFYKELHEKQEEQNNRQKEIDNAKEQLKNQYNEVQSMGCSLKTVQEFERLHDNLKQMGVSNDDLDSFIGKECEMTIKHYKDFFNELEKGSYDQYKSTFKYNDKTSRSPIIEKFFSKEQQKFIADKLVKSGSKSFRDYSSEYKKQNKKTFRELNKEQ